MRKQRKLKRRQRRWKNQNGKKVTFNMRIETQWTNDVFTKEEMEQVWYDPKELDAIGQEVDFIANLYISTATRKNSSPNRHVIDENKFPKRGLEELLENDDANVYNNINHTTSRKE